MSKKLAALGVAALLSVAAGGVVAYAAVIGPDGTIHGCYSNRAFNGSHALFVTDGTCPSGSTALNWNQTGAQGPQGPQGAQGPQGPPGPPGSIPPASKSFTINQTVPSGSTTFTTQVGGTPTTINASLIYATSDQLNIDFLFSGPGGTPGLDITFAHSVPYTNLILSQPLPVASLVVTCLGGPCAINVSIVGS